MHHRSQFLRLLDFSQRILEQGISLIDLARTHADIAFDSFIGPHLRHVIEHYETFVQQAGGRTIDYDARLRDRDVERDPALARARLQALSAAIAQLEESQLSNPVAIHLLGGMAGDEHFVTFSTVERELMFLASHAIHHYAQLKLHLHAHGIELDPDFGKAPSTIHHEHQTH
ncbi:hypothetical protein E4T66_20195 [Sinimarinibacterium sp. CAU 1509]|uniref:hypothetical protein n=1 Tax=Sinimarinibacterium sp. CAU 1509 TaxID=2562283 RepID=UPI0010AD03C2|nr:hypothetical protein [Sinimarinibacterium sp. CAU 1509]TJY55912.1 hypothetical protein E4T66_20195 [Sinimarinibacterium sp. CAU 1509]